MFECPEVTTISRQMRETLPGKRISAAEVMGTPHKFAFLNRPPEEYAPALADAVLGEAFDDGSSIYLPCEPGWLLVFGEVVGRLLYHAPGAVVPERRQLLLNFDDGSALTLTISMWAALQLVAVDEFASYTRWTRRRPHPLSPDFTWDYFSSHILADQSEWERKSVKRMLVSKPAVQGVANGCLHDMLFYARLNPKHLAKELSTDQQRALYDATVTTVRAMADAGGRDVERDLYGNPGYYHGVLGSWSAGQPCPRDGGVIQKIAYLGGTSYYCPLCQP
ncbi:MAG: hypothetical protein LLG44_11885 [Chloroflexi bacterium]|nr:hypothetical protein [Chloroflexota bacterium]